MPDRSAFEQLLRRDRIVVGSGLAFATGLAWLYVVSTAGSGTVPITHGEMAGMSMDMPGMAMPAAPWSAGYFLMMLVMSAVMLPAATPMILLFAAIARKNRDGLPPYVPTSLFALGYLLLWLGFSLAATSLQWGLDRLALLSSSLATASVAVAGAVLIAAGVYQLTPLKAACLRHCRAPLEFLTRHWRRGRRGALLMGAHHGLYCIGCCWMMMLVLFVGGVMNLAWIAGRALRPDREDNPRRALGRPPCRRRPDQLGRRHLVRRAVIGVVMRIKKPPSGKGVGIRPADKCRLHRGRGPRCSRSSLRGLSRI